jgi:DtxR family Mn-dependent transcriptional regulator
MSTTTESAEMYLKTICELESDDEPVAISSVAERLGVSPVSANEMVKRLVERGLLNHTLYKGVTLTDSGRRRALTVLRRHRLWERFMVDKLGIAWERSHDLACRLEHSTDDEITEALAAFMDHPTTCPHGNPIPTPGGDMAQPSVVPLSELEIGQSGRVICIFREETTLLNYLAAREIFPGQIVLVEDIAPFNGPITARIGGRTHALGREIAAHIFIEAELPAPAKKPAADDA